MSDSTDSGSRGEDQGLIRSIIDRIEPEGVERRGVDWDPLIAGGASLVVPGAGQWYNDQPARAAGLIAIALALLLSYVFVGEPAILVGIFVEPLLRLIAGYDAYSTRQQGE